MGKKSRQKRPRRWTQPNGGPIRPAGAPLDPVLIAAFEAVEPPGFRDHPRSAIDAADVDVDDTIGGE